MTKQSEAPRRAKFSDDSIRRTDIPRDAFLLLHDLCYDHEGRDRKNYKRRAQAILSIPNPKPVCVGCSYPVSFQGDYCGECICEEL